MFFLNNFLVIIFCMYSTSTQKKYWTFSSSNEINELRIKANNNYIERYRLALDYPEQEVVFLAPNEEALLCRIVTETGIRF